MMRENIGIFRGKDTIEHKWRYGNLTAHGDTAQIWVNTEQGLVNYLVDPETVGEFTGLFDKEQTGIFEGDILLSHAYDSYGRRDVISTVRYGAFKPGFFYDFAHERGYDFSLKIYGLHAYVFSDGEEIVLSSDMSLTQVIGNIYENPELLKGEEKNESR